MNIHATMGRLRQTLSVRLKPGAPTIEPFEGYQLWAAGYDDTDGNALLFTEERYVRAWFDAEKLQNKDLLDAGCGTGRYLRALQDFHPRSIAIMDFSPNMLEKAINKIDGSVPVYSHIARVEDPPFKDASFDFILSTLVLDHTENMKAAVHHLSLLLRPGGTMIISCFHPFGHLLGWQRTFRGKDGVVAVKYHRHLHAEYLDAFLANGLRLTRIEEPIIDESVKHFYDKAGRADIYCRFKGYPMLLIMEVQHP